MRRLLPAVLVLATGIGCNPPPASDTPVSGPATTDAPEVLSADVVRPDLTPSPTTTEPAPTTTHYHPPTTTTTAPAVVPMTAAPPVRSGGRLGDPYYTPTWHTLRECEAPDWSGGWQANTGNGFYGGLQFTLSSWEWVGGSGYPHHASVDEQIRRGQMLWERQGWRAWPACSRKLGWR